MEGPEDVVKDVELIKGGGNWPCGELWPHKDKLLWVDEEGLKVCDNMGFWKWFRFKDCVEFGNELGWNVPCEYWFSELSKFNINKLKKVWYF
jgi:hypothetical protein